MHFVFSLGSEKCGPLTVSHFMCVFTTESGAAVNHQLKIQINLLTFLILSAGALCENYTFKLWYSVKLLCNFIETH